MPKSDLVVVFDTNVLVLLILDASLSRRVFDRLRSAGGKVALTPQLLAEVTVTLQKPRFRRWLGRSQAQVDTFLESLPKLCLNVRRVPHVHGVVKADPDDDKVLAAALASRASFIITEDRHLLELERWRGIKILNRRQFDESLSRSQSKAA